MITKIIMAIAILFGGATTKEPLITQPPKNAKCPQFWQTALQVGWPKNQLATLDKIMFRESRCIPSAFNSKDPSGGSRGLVQINGFWTPWLTEQGVLRRPGAPEALFNPAINLLSALHIYNYGVDRYEDGWGPWNL